ncbi:MAG: hypothetical protein SFH39_02105 [Candidatus Magnetobacterium sp. LHC-1]
MALKDRIAESGKEVCEVVSKEFGRWCEKAIMIIWDSPVKPFVHINEDKSLSFGITVTLSLDKLEENIEDIISWINDMVLSQDGQTFTMDMIERVCNDKGVKVDTINKINHFRFSNSDIGTRFRSTYDYVVEHGYVGGFTNFHQANYGKGIVNGTIFLKHEAAEWRDILASELGNPDVDDVGARFRSVYDYAIRHGYVGGFPNFHQANYGTGVVYGTILLKHEAAEWRDILASELGNPDADDVGARFRSVHDYAIRHGYVGGFPNFHQANYGTGVVYNAILLKHGAVECKDVHDWSFFSERITCDLKERPADRPIHEKWESPWDDPSKGRLIERLTGRRDR